MKLGSGGGEGIQVIKVIRSGMFLPPPLGVSVPRSAAGGADAAGRPRAESDIEKGAQRWIAGALLWSRTLDALKRLADRSN